MTLPNERLNAVRYTYDFLVRLSSPYNGGFKNIPSEIRIRARDLMRHYPWEMHMEHCEEKCYCGVFREKVKKTKKSVTKKRGK